jgi:Enoyl-(Acyl carrier protein) reductase
MNYIKSLAKQLASKGVRVNGVTPGPVWTPLQNSGGAPEQKYEKFGNTTVFGRQPAELASIYVQLAAAEPALPPETSTVPAADRVNREASLTRRCSHATHKRSSRPRGSTAGAKASRLHKCYRGGNHLPRAAFPLGGNQQGDNYVADTTFSCCTDLGAPIERGRVRARGRRWR